MELKLNLREHRLQFLINYFYTFFYFGAMGMIAEIGEYQLKK